MIQFVGPIVHKSIIEKAACRAVWTGRAVGAQCSWHTLGAKATHFASQAHVFHRVSVHFTWPIGVHISPVIVYIKTYDILVANTSWAAVVLVNEPLYERLAANGHISVAMIEKILSNAATK